MNDKERLNDIEGRVNKLDWLADAKGNATVDIFAVQIDFKWLIDTIKQQQKEIESITEHYNHAAQGNNWRDDDRIRLKEQNKRYHEAIEKAMEEAILIKDCDKAIDHMSGILGEALEVEE